MNLGNIFLAVVVSAACFGAEHGARASYVGGTRGDIPNQSGGTLQVIDEQYMVFYSKHSSVRVPYEKISIIEYGLKVDRRYAMAALISPVFILSKKREHFLTVVFADDRGREQAMIFKVAKGDIRAMLVSLEARTGRKVQFQDGEARKAGKG